MKKKNWTLVVAVAMVSIAVIILSCMLIKILNDYTSQEICDTITETFDSVDRNMATNQLSELRGKFLEISSLSRKDVAQSLLLDELAEITSLHHFTNPYLKDFTFDVPGTSNVREICDELISQIDDQIKIIEGRKAGD